MKNSAPLRYALFFNTLLAAARLVASLSVLFVPPWLVFGEPLAG